MIILTPKLISCTEVDRSSNYVKPETNCSMWWLLATRGYLNRN